MDVMRLGRLAAPAVRFRFGVSILLLVPVIVVSGGDTARHSSTLAVLQLSFRRPSLMTNTCLSRSNHGWGKVGRRLFGENAVSLLVFSNLGMRRSALVLSREPTEQAVALFFALGAGPAVAGLGIRGRALPQGMRLLLWLLLLAVVLKEAMVICSLLSGCRLPGGMSNG
jgi:hypothetical protein